MAARRKAWIVARREFLTTVKRKSYLIFTFGMPLFATAYIGLVGILPAMLLEKRESEETRVGVVDQTLERLVRFEAPDGEEALPDTAAGALEVMGQNRPDLQAAAQAVMGNVSFVTFASEEEALEALRGERLARYYVVPADYLETGAMRLVVGKESAITGSRGAGDRFRAHLRDSVLRWGEVDEAVRARVERPIDRSQLEELMLRDDGTLGPRDQKEKIARILVPGAFALLLLMALMFTSGYLLQGVAEEKENRVIEIILSSVRPDDLLLGKVVGLGAAGLIQLVVWSSVGLAAGLATAFLTGVDLPLLVLCLALFLAGYLTIGTLMAGTGSLGNSLKESQQMASLWSLLSVLPPAFTWFLITDDPLGVLARVLSYVPFTAPITMMLRLGAAGPPWKPDGVPWWDLGLCFLALGLGTWIGLKLGGKLFRLGILMTGKKPKLKVLIRLLRAA